MIPESMAPFLVGLAAGFGIAIPVGAVAILIVNTALDCGFRIGFMAGAGAATADLIYALLAALAGAALSPWLAPLAHPLRVAGGLALIGIAAWGLWRGLRPPTAVTRPPATRLALPTYARFVALTLLNPLTIVYFAAYILGRPASAVATPLAGSMLFVLGAGLASISWQTLLAALGGLARQRLTPRFRMVATGLGNVIVLTLGLRILLQAALPMGG